MKKTYLRRITTPSTLNWVMSKVEKGRKGAPGLESDREKLKKWFVKYGWTPEMPTTNPNGLIPMVHVGGLDDVPRISKLVEIGHYCLLFECPKNEKIKLWVVVVPAEYS